MENFKIVVVDDEPIITHTLCQILRGAGYRAFAAYEAEGAMMLCKHHSADLLLSDVNMPGISGIELAQQVARELPNCKVILLSGHVDTAPLLSEAREQGFRCGAPDRLDRSHCPSHGCVCTTIRKPGSRLRQRESLGDHSPVTNTEA